MTASWWTGLAPVQTTIDCGGQPHRLRWDQGLLITPDHADPDGERTLAALGGASCECVELLDAWHRHSNDLDVLLLTSRGGTDFLQPADDERGGGIRAMPARYPAMPARYASAMRSSAGRRGGGGSGWTSFSPLAAGSHPESDDGLTRLLRLPAPLGDRLTAGVIAHWTQRLDDHDPEALRVIPTLHAALYGRALATLNQWLGPDHHVDVTLAEVTAVRDGFADPRLELPFSWLRDVWARSFAVIAGRFCLTATPSDANTWSFTTIGPDLGEPRIITLRID